MKQITYEQFYSHNLNNMVSAVRRVYDEYKEAKGKNLRWLAPPLDLERGLKQYFNHWYGDGPAIHPARFEELYLATLNRQVSRIRKHITKDTVIVGWDTEDGKVQTDVLCKFLDKLFRHS